MQINSQPILVVGGAGFIGSHMVLTLKQAGFPVVVLDNLVNGYRESVLDAELIVGDMADTSLLEQLFETHHFSAVMHFASFIEVAESMQYPAKYYQNNVAGTLNLLAVMLKNKVKQLIFSSTAAVYGEPRYAPIDENHPIQPINPYGRSKWMIEQIIQDYAKSDRLDYAILRYFNAAGADPAGKIGERHEPESHLIPRILQVAKGEQKKLIVYGRHHSTPDGTCVRDYIHVMDLCRAHLLALKALREGEKNIICNLGTGEGHSVQQVIDAAHRVTHRAISIEDQAARAGDPAILVADSSYAKKLLKWQPHYKNLDILIQHTWQFMTR